MNTFETNRKDNPEDIYFFSPNLPYIDTSILFKMEYEDTKLRVQNNHVNCLYHNLTIEEFDKIYNDYNRYLNLDFEPILISDKVYALTLDEQQKLFETIVTNWIYYHTVNNLPVEVKRSDFKHPCMADYVLTLLDKKYGIDTKESLALGAKILRQDPKDYTQMVKGRRIYYNR